MNIRFFYNGLKVDGSKDLVRAHYYLIDRWDTGKLIIEDQLVICARSYDGFPVEVYKVFEVENATDYQTDYFDKDRARVLPTHPLYTAVLEAFEKQQLRTIKRCMRRGDKVRVRIAEREIERARALLERKAS